MVSKTEEVFRGRKLFQPCLLYTSMFNKEIGVELGISERTVQNHLSSIFKKIDSSDRTQAAVFAIRNGLVDIK